MAEGISVLCKQGLSGWGNSSLLMGQPYAVVNKMDKVQLKWDKEVFIALTAKMPYQITIQWPHPIKKACNAATLTLSLNEGEVQRYEYKVPGTGIGAGKMKRIN